MKYTRHISTSHSIQRGSVIDTEDANVAIQYWLNRLAGAANETDAQKLVRELLSVAAEPILSLCGTTLSRH